MNIQGSDVCCRDCVCWEQLNLFEGQCHCTPGRIGYAYPGNRNQDFCEEFWAADVRKNLPFMDYVSVEVEGKYKPLGKCTAVELDRLTVEYKRLRPRCNYE